MTPPSDFYPCRECGKVAAYEPNCLCDACKPTPKRAPPTRCSLCGSANVARDTFDDAAWKEFLASGLCAACQKESIKERNVV